MFSKHTLQTLITTVASSIAKVTHTLAYWISKNLLMNMHASMCSGLHLKTTGTNL